MRTIIQTPTSKLADSVDFYKKLGFQILSEETSVLLSDGNFVMEINPDRFARAGVKIYRTSWADTVAYLRSHVHVTEIEGGYLLSEPSGTCFYLLEGDYDVELGAKQETVLGNYMGISLESTDMKKTCTILKVLGFKKTMGDEESSWVAFANDDGLGISVMGPMTCPHLFFSPSLTYFNSGKNPEVIQRVRDLNIPITEEITHFNKEGIVDNIIIRDPGGFGFFLFND